MLVKCEYKNDVIIYIERIKHNVTLHTGVQYTVKWPYSMLSADAVWLYARPAIHMSCT